MKLEIEKSFAQFWYIGKGAKFSFQEREFLKVKLFSLLSDIELDSSTCRD